jgi:membrane-associated phospholipid phosphatase
MGGICYHSPPATGPSEDTGITTPASPAEAPARRGAWRWIIVTVVVLAGFVVAHLLDGPAYRVTGDGSMESSAVWWMFRTMGYLPFWILVAAALLLIDLRRYAGRPVRRVTRRAELVFWSVLLAGIAANLLKLVIRRERPLYHDGAYVFREFLERPFDGGGLGMPSGDMAIASAAAFVLIRLYPGGTIVWLAMLLGVAVCRVGGGSHFLSDVYLGAVVGFLAALVVWRLNRRTMRRVEAAEGA